MSDYDVIVIGGGISGIAFAWKATRKGRSVLLLEAADIVGGCLDSHRSASGHWFEMGAHTTYNSYGGFLEIAEGSGATHSLQPRGEARTGFGLLRGESVAWLTPPKLLRRFNWLEIARHAPFGIFRKKAGQTMSGYYGGIIGQGNYRRFLSPFLAAVPSQNADGFPAEGPGSLFKKRERKEDFPRSYGFEGGLRTVCEAAVKTPGLSVRMGTRALRVRPEGSGFAVTTGDGETLKAQAVAVAVAAEHAAGLLQEDFGELAGVLGKIGVVEVESVGIALPRERCWMPEIAFLVPVDDIFWSAVTRDPFPDPGRRAFAFHFKAGTARNDKLRRMAEVLRVEPAELQGLVERRRRIPAPALGHDRIVTALDEHLEGRRLALTGNYFQGLAIEDCVQRSFQEWERIERS